MEKKLLLVIFALVFLSGCESPFGLGGQPITYDNNVITLQHYVVDPVNPYAGSATSISFDLQENSNLPVKNVEVRLFDPEQFTISNLNCQKGQNTDDRTCFFSEIIPEDSRKVSIELIAPNEGVKVPIKHTITYSVKYDYSGFKQGAIPVIDEEKRPNGPKTKYEESPSSVGPVQVDFSPPLGGQEKKDSQTVNEYWGVKGKPFQMAMAFKAISTNVGKVAPVAIPKNQVKLILDKVKIAQNLPCSFNSDGTAKDDVKVPSTLLCNFEPTDLSQDEITALVALSYDYTYQFTKSETFNVQPLTENT